MAKRTLNFLTLTLTFLTACQMNSDKQSFKHDYSKYWDLYTDKQLVNELYADTLIFGSDMDHGNRAFYMNATSELLNDLQDDLNKIYSLYPQTAFDELTIRELPLGFEQPFSSDQVNKFLEIINNPTSFDWSETTYEPEYRTYSTTIRSSQL